MTEAETADIVRRVVGTWPMSPKGPLWTEAIGGLDYAASLAAYTQLRDDVEEQRLPIARFKMAVRAVAARGNTNRRHPSEEDHDGPVMSPNEYFARLAWRAGTGDSEAIEMEREWSTPMATAFLRGGRVLARS